MFSSVLAALDPAVSALITAVGVVAAASIPSYFAMKASKQTKRTHAEVVTNHGRRLGERIEALNDQVDVLVSTAAEMQERQRLHAETQDQISLKLTAQGRDVSSLLALMAEHASDQHAHGR